MYIDQLQYMSRNNMYLNNSNCDEKFNKEMLKKVRHKQIKIGSKLWQKHEQYPNIIKTDGNHNWMYVTEKESVACNQQQISNPQLPSYPPNQQTVGVQLGYSYVDDSYEKSYKLPNASIRNIALGAMYNTCHIAYTIGKSEIIYSLWYNDDVLQYLPENLLKDFHIIANAYIKILNNIKSYRLILIEYEPIKRHVCFVLDDVPDIRFVLKNNTILIEERRN